MADKILTIAGSDSLSGGGIQADLATFNEFGYFGLSVITSIVTVTMDNFRISPVDVDLIRAQLDSVLALDDIVVIKVGLLPTVNIIDLVANYLSQVNVPIVVDPVMVFKESDTANTNYLADQIKQKLLPLATVVTPNLSEAQMLSNITIKSIDDMKVAAKIIADFGVQNVVIKSGARLPGSKVITLLFKDNHYKVFEQDKIVTVLPMNNGSGCTFSSGIAANIARTTIENAILDSESFVRSGIENGVLLNKNFEVGNVWQAARRLRKN
ncbi:hydroxymethylpyrimidine/phosphomethylpyrimidine kinase [Leuconostoc litchii]|uniref:pyridoxal kinase n=1 Tax=Leuconostoc litchii TaxID=1981069 RepID=A0A6P2CMM9_9LACO|nr:hydroxymethylpyrimidine/phosphomethylpyrimidine kinase [Leuconostoc litchii]TYC47190.1 hydroxymethylpyrimidine/phosphomethylpyrimidine kinase [Leuconostoc litchii]GMA69159.1 hydroxymethylpyrimidine/phosphomethylpyrimidine kinase [Leuconostoc litchii]